jgi:hypothetical protein
MKHVKLFEEFVQDMYILTNKLPNGLRINGITFTGSDQLKALIKELESLGVGYKYTYMNSRVDRERSIENAEHTPNTVLWLNVDSMKCYYSEMTPQQIEGEISKGNIVKFEDFFKENPVFHGNHTGKKYGI